MRYQNNYHMGDIDHIHSINKQVIPSHIQFDWHLCMLAININNDSHLEMLNKVTSTMVTGEGQGAGEQVNLNELDSQMEQIKEMFVKKQEMMKKMSTGVVSTNYKY